MRTILCPKCDGHILEVGAAPVGVFRQRLTCLFCLNCATKIVFNSQGVYDNTEQVYKTTGPDVLKKAVQSNKKKLQETYADLQAQRDKCCAGACEAPNDKSVSKELDEVLEKMAALETEMKINKQDQKQIEEKYGIEL